MLLNILKFNDKNKEVNKTINSENKYLTIYYKLYIRNKITFVVILLLLSCISIPFNLKQLHPFIHDWINEILINVMNNPNNYGICSDIVPLLFSKFFYFF